MNYNLVQTDTVYTVQETVTNQAIKTFTVFLEAKKFMRHLNLGGGFDGLTPNFFLTDVSKSFKQK